MSMRNLYEETYNRLKENNKTWEDVEYIIVDGGYKGEFHQQFDIETFKTVIQKINYDFGYGSIELNPWLKIVGKDWWLERQDYDGREWWEFKTKPELNKNITFTRDKQKIRRLIKNYDNF